MTELHPGLILMAGGLAAPLLPHVVRRIFLAGLPLAGLWLVWVLPADATWSIPAFGLSIELLHVDPLANVFAVLFLGATWLTVLFCYSSATRLQAAIVPIFAGSAVSAVYAGDLIGLFVFGEMAVLSSVFLVWSPGDERAYRAGLRYLFFQALSSVLLFEAVVVRAHASGEAAFDAAGLAGTGAGFMLVAFGIRCAFPLLHTWLNDACAKAPLGPTVALLAITANIGVYGLARNFPGTDVLVWIGLIMVIVPIWYGIIENDIRKLLTHSLNTQLGFVIAGIGLGSTLALAGALVHAFTQAVAIALLALAVGSVVRETGKFRLSQLGGLARTMPWTAAACCIGAATIAGLPLFGGFVGKEMIIVAAQNDGHWIVAAILVMASAGVLFQVALRLPFGVFFGVPQATAPREAPWPSRVAMFVAAVVCVGVGSWPQGLLADLPDGGLQSPYTYQSVLSHLQVFCFAALVYGWLNRKRLVPASVPGVNLDADVVYLRLFPKAVRSLVATFAPIDRNIRARSVRSIQAIFAAMGWIAEPGRRTILLSHMVSWIVSLLAVYLAVNFIARL
jgi:multicomponent Na+:H+ antiporter subunit D